MATVKQGNTQLLTRAEKSQLLPYLIDFCQHLKEKGAVAPHLLKSMVLADAFCEFFSIRCPIEAWDVSGFLHHVKHLDVFIQQGLEKKRRVRGYREQIGEDILILLDAARPEPSRIKTFFHEIAELMFEIGYRLWPGTKVLENRRRETLANKFAAMMKMPPPLFLNAAMTYGLDLESISDTFRDTLAGVTRHIRDLWLTNRPFYFCRVSLELNPQAHCPRLMDALERSGGFSVYIADAVKTPVVNTRRHRAGGALPFYNVAKRAEYRVVPRAILTYFQQDKPQNLPPLYIPRLSGASGCEIGHQDLFGMQDLAVLIFPTGKRRLHGFYLVAAHPDDVHLFNRVMADKQPFEQPDIEWLFSWDYDRYHRVPDDDYEKEQEAQQQLELLPNGDTVEEEEQLRIRWPQVDPLLQENDSPQESKDK